MEVLAPFILPGLGLLLLLGLVGVVYALVGNRGAPEIDSSRLSQFAGRRAEAGDGNAAAALQARLEEAVTKGKRGGSLARDLARADLKLKVIEFIALKAASAVAGVGFGLFLGRASLPAQLIAALVFGILFSFIPNLYLGIRIRGRIRAFNSQLGDTITLLANSIRSGYSLLQSMELVAREAPVPVSSEFRRVVQEVGLGLTTEKALQNLLRRVPSEDLELMVTAVSIQMEVGGNLSQILDTIGHTIRERVRIKGEINTLTAQGRLSGLVVTLMPVGLAIFITLYNPEYMAPLLTWGFPPDAWCCMPVTSAIMMLAGYFVIMKIVDIEV